MSNTQILNLGAFSSNFPDIPPQQSQFIRNYINYSTGTIRDPSVLQNDINSLNELIASLKNVQMNVIRSIPEYTNPNAAPKFLSNISTVHAEASTLQTQLDITNANIQNQTFKLTGDISDLMFYTYSTATVILGIICISLITFLIYRYLYTPAPAPMVGGRIQKMLHMNRRHVD
jgi:hypothetical protein